MARSNPVMARTRSGTSKPRLRRPRVVCLVTPGSARRYPASLTRGIERPSRSATVLAVTTGIDGRARGNRSTVESARTLPTWARQEASSRSSSPAKRPTSAQAPAETQMDQGSARPPVRCRRGRADGLELRVGKGRLPPAPGVRHRTGARTGHGGVPAPDLEAAGRTPRCRGEPCATDPVLLLAQLCAPLLVAGPVNRRACRSQMSWTVMSRPASARLSAESIAATLPRTARGVVNRAESGLVDDVLLTSRRTLMRSPSMNELATASARSSNRASASRLTRPG